MKCTKCDTENNSNAKYCVKCGHPLNETKRKFNFKLIAGVIAVIAVITVVIFTVPTDNMEATNPTCEIDGIIFSVPVEGYYKQYDKFYFNFTGHKCCIKKVDAFEDEIPVKTIEPVKLEKYYPGAQTYRSHYSDSGETYYGIKIKKENEWFHIAILTEDENQAVKFLDWIYKYNTWEGHD